MAYLCYLVPEKMNQTNAKILFLFTIHRNSSHKRQQQINMYNLSVYHLCTIVPIVYSFIGVISATTCTTDGCIKASASMRSFMDESVQPCDDFYEFACGKFMQNQVIPEDKSIYNTFSIIQDKVDEELKTILTQEPQSNEPKPFRLAKIFTKTCLDENQLNEKGIAPMVEILDRYGGWPAVKGNDWQSNNFDWLDALKRISRDGLDNLIFECAVSVDLRNTNRRLLSVSLCI